MALPAQNFLQEYKIKLFEGNVKSPLERLRLYIYVVCTLLTITGCLLHFFGVMGIKRPVLLGLSTFWFCSDSLLLTLFLTHKLKLRYAFFWSAVSSQIVESVRLIYLACSETMTVQQFYINEFTCFAILIVVILGFLPKTALILTITNIITLLVSRFFVPEYVNSMTMAFFFLLSIAMCSYCIASVKFVKQITMENDEVKGKYNSFLSFMRMSDTEATSLIQLVRTAFDDEEHIDMLVGKLSDETKTNLVKVARRIHDSKLAKEERIRKCFPILSPTEITVCQLVMMGHTQKGIARIMDKTENNISTVRGNIRRKLTLESSQDLREYLLEKVKE